MKKKILSLALALTFILAFVPAVSPAAIAVAYVEVIPPKYDNVRDFSEGLAAVMLGDKWGFIDKTGKEVIPLTLDFAQCFSEGFAVFYEGIEETWGIEGVDTAVTVYKWGFIDKTGRKVIPAIYDRAERFSEGLAAVRLNGKWGFIDATGNAVIPLTLEYHWIEPFSEGMALVELDGKMGFIDKSGNEAIPLIYFNVMSEIHVFSGGLATVASGSWDGWENIKWGVIDKTGREVVPLIYDSMVRFFEGLARVRQDGKWGFIGTTGNVVIPLIYDSASGFSEGLAVVQLDGKWKLIDTAGKEIISLNYDTVGNFFDGLAIVTLDDKRGFIDKSGDIVVPITLEYDWLGRFVEGMAMVGVGDWDIGFKYGFIDENGNEVVPLIYDVARDVSEGMAAVLLSDKWGFIALALDPLSTASPWAHTYINTALGHGIIPTSLQNNYTRNTTRAEFAALAVLLYETATGRVIPTGGNPFTDTTDINAVKAAAIGVTTGTTPTTFTPDRQLNREEAAAMLSRLAVAIGKPLPDAAPDFTDGDRISNWATGYVGRVQAEGIMGGSGGRFTPQDPYTREQSITTMVRMWEWFNR